MAHHDAATPLHDEVVSTLDLHTCAHRAPGSTPLLETLSVQPMLEMRARAQDTTILVTTTDSAVDEIAFSVPNNITRSVRCLVAEHNDISHGPDVRMRELVAAESQHEIFIPSTERSQTLIHASSATIADLISPSAVSSTTVYGAGPEHKMGTCPHPIATMTHVVTSPELSDFSTSLLTERALAPSRGGAITKPTTYHAPALG